MTCRWGIGLCERRSPGGPVGRLSLDRQKGPQAFEVGDEVIGGVGMERAQILVGVRTRPSCAPLVGRHDVPAGGIEEAEQPLGCAAARAAVQKDDGGSGRVREGLPSNLVATLPLQPVGSKGLGFHRTGTCLGAGPW